MKGEEEVGGNGNLRRTTLRCVVFANLEEVLSEFERVAVRLEESVERLAQLDVDVEVYDEEYSVYECYICGKY